MVFVLPGVTKDCNPQENSKYDFGHYYKVLLTMKKKKVKVGVGDQKSNSCNWEIPVFTVLSHIIQTS